MKVITVLFHSVKGRRPALSFQWRAEGPHSISLFHSVKGHRPALSSQWFLQHLHESDSDFTAWGVVYKHLMSSAWWWLLLWSLSQKQCSNCVWNPLVFSYLASMSVVVCVVCRFTEDEKLKNIHVDLALLVWGPALLSTHTPLPL